MGKGSQRRPRRIPGDDYDSAWDKIFGPKKKDPTPPPPASPAK